jgi:hypothetical protein
MKIDRIEETCLICRNIAMVRHVFGRTRKGTCAARGAVRPE